MGDEEPEAEANLEKSVTGPDGCEWRFRLDPERWLVFLRRRLDEMWSPETCVGGIHHVLPRSQNAFQAGLNGPFDFSGGVGSDVGTPGEACPVGGG